MRSPTHRRVQSVMLVLLS